MGPMGLCPIVASAVGTVPALTPSAQAGYLLELRADKGVITTGVKVRIWGDQSSNAYDFMQATSANQPTLISSWWNGLPGIQFQGTELFMQPSVNVVFGSPKATIYTVHMLDYSKFTGGSNMYRFGGSNTSAHNAIRVACNPTASGIVVTDNTVSPAGTSSATFVYPYSPISYPLVSANTFDMTTTSGTLGMASYFNGGTAAAPSNVTDPTMGGTNIDSTTQCYVGDNAPENTWMTVGHVIAFNALHTTTVIAGVSQYLRNLWNVG